MKGNGKPRVNMATAILNLLTFNRTRQQIAQAQILEANGLSEIATPPRTRDRMANKKGYRGHAKNPAGTKLLRKGGTIGVRHPSAVDSYFNNAHEGRIGRRLGV